MIFSGCCKIGLSAICMVSLLPGNNCGCSGLSSSWNTGNLSIFSICKDSLIQNWFKIFSNILVLNQFCIRESLQIELYNRMRGLVKHFCFIPALP